jgi:hypothetical protein
MLHEQKSRPRAPRFPEGQNRKSGAEKLSFQAPLAAVAGPARLPHYARPPPRRQRLWRPCSLPVPELSPMSLRLAGAPALLALALPLAGCFGPERDTFAPACPAVHPLPGAGEMAIYRPGGGRDLTDVQIEGSILGVQGSCRDGDRKGTVDATLTLRMRFQRGPAAPTRQANIPYFVAVAEGDSILNKQIYVQPVVFPPNVDAANATTPPVEVILPVSPARSAAAYTIWVGFQK